MSDKISVKMNDSKDKFLQRMLWYRLQTPVGAAIGMAVWYVILISMPNVIRYSNEIITGFMIFGFLLINSLSDTIAYCWSKYFAKKYGVDMLADLDKESLLRHQEFDSKAFGEYFARLNQYNKISGIYMLAVIVPAAFINLYLATAVGAIYFIGYYTYRITHSDAISYKVPNVFIGWRHRCFQDHLRGNYAESR